MGGFAVLKDKQDKSEMIEENDEIQNQETLGNKLQKARKDLNLSVEDVAEKLRLKSVVIKNFENDIFTQPDLPATFTKGYLRSYVRFLKLPDELLTDTVCSETKTASVNIKPLKMKPQSKPCRGLLKVITTLVLLVAFGMTLLWWWQNYQQEQQDRETLVTNSDNTTLQALNTTTEKEENKKVDNAKDENVSDSQKYTEKQTNVLLQTQPDETKSANTQAEVQSKVEQPTAIKDDLRSTYI